MIVIGSRAFQHEFMPGVAPTIEMDYDFISTLEEWSQYQARMNGRPIAVKNPNAKAFVVSDGKARCCYHEAYIIRPGSSDELIDNAMGNPRGEQVYATGEILLAIKMAHRFKKNTQNFTKTMFDIIKLREFGVELTPLGEEIRSLREKESLSYSHPKLNVNKSDFFKDDIYTYDHDTIHEAIAVTGTPAYKSYMVDGEQVMTSKEKFFQCDRETQILGVYEESCVLALERCLVPFPNKAHPNTAFLMALEKVCTSITSGWFREFAWENYAEVVRFYRNRAKSAETAYYEMFKRNQHLLKSHK